MTDIRAAVYRFFSGYVLHKPIHLRKKAEFCQGGLLKNSGMINKLNTVYFA